MKRSVILSGRINLEEPLVHVETLKEFLHGLRPVQKQQARLIVFICAWIHSGGTNRWALISHFTRQRNGFKVERPEGWRRRKKERRRLHEEEDAAGAAVQQTLCSNMQKVPDTNMSDLQPVF